MYIVRTQAETDLLPGEDASRPGADDLLVVQPRRHFSRDRLRRPPRARLLHAGERRGAAPRPRDRGAHGPRRLDPVGAPGPQVPVRQQGRHGQHLALRVPAVAEPEAAHDYEVG